MKHTILFLAVVMLLLSCKKTSESPYQSKGVIFGDLILFTCNGCPGGGLEITIKNDPSKNPPPYYLINEPLAQLGIDPNTKFPINVSLNWERDTVQPWASANYIIVNKITANN